ncbi:MAG TPA: glycosyltransferase family 2 protein [Candidatus Mucispirillum faecigallinarum]|uniref:Glycosyltransferase family 2 protein n=1 Tax=Candidatus Mucispirillum faecigallinarum TaxID=2838699 RepID=A0A9D2GWT2_9BACT|nr:glycosyltransferase family 2 protein [Candidatus Mucispirillum faecigallinarum]
MDKVAVLIPCYNEELTIGKVVDDFKKSLPEAVIYVYDNNSKDKTAEIAKEHGAVVRYERKQGKGNVMRSMFRDIDAECYILVDGDDTYPAEAAPELVSAVIDKGGDLVIGDRLSSTYFTENKRPFHNSGNVLVKQLINKFFKSDIKDIMTGYRAFSYEFVKTFPVLSQGFEIETEMTIHALDKNFSIISIPIQYRDRPEGSKSKLNTYKDGFKVIMTIFNLYRLYKPFQFFSIFALLFLILSILFFIPVFIDYARTGIVPKFPSLIVSTALLIVSALSFSVSLILDSVRKNSRQQFEIFLNMVNIFKKGNK